ncbi:hypothetical protein HanXRQr2_Chr12g0559361 [Helianthus annuus]|uniref:Uncharacterized protein n=1 Tax=Helianthus annuus TaxID=4232 RepID=A0A9K3HJF6_HELAN|nr:hypothetical protein HanXRQr2_Chr12g0559361 [Helianthus annuus]
MIDERDKVDNKESVERWWTRYCGPSCIDVYVSASFARIKIQDHKKVAPLPIKTK